MAKHTIILDTGNALVALLREYLCPEIILNPDTIGLCSPNEKGDMMLGVHLYDVRESDEVRVNDMINVSAKVQRYPSTYLSLSYMVTAYSAADVKFRAGEDQRIMGKVVQTLSDHAVLHVDSVNSTSTPGAMDIRIRMQSLSMDEKQKLWQFPNVPQRLSLFYKVSPVEVESVKTREVKRVVEMDFSVKE